MTRRLVVVCGVMGFALLPSGARAFEHERDAAICGQIGAMRYLADEDSREGAKPRFLFAGYGEYSISRAAAVRVESGFGWNAYPSDKTPTDFEHPKPVKVVSPTIVSYLRRLNPESNQVLYAGGGVGIYFWRYKINGKVQEDPLTFKPIQSDRLGLFNFGLHALVGYERPVTDRVALSAEVIGHYIFSANEKKRPEKPAGSEFADVPEFNGNDAFAALRVGVKLYFDLARFENPEDVY